jgi:hypothetical protein
MLNIAAGTAKVPGLEDAITDHIKAEGTRAVADRLTPVTTGFLRAHEVEVRAHFAKIGWFVSGEILERVSEELARTEVVLPLARDAVSPEAFALLLKALQEINWASELHGIGDLDRKEQGPGVVWEEGPGKNFVCLVGEQLGEVVMTLARAHALVFG